MKNLSFQSLSLALLTAGSLMLSTYAAQAQEPAATSHHRAPMTLEQARNRAHEHAKRLDNMTEEEWKKAQEKRAARRALCKKSPEQCKSVRAKLQAMSPEERAAAKAKWQAGHPRANGAPAADAKPQ